jgi:hypothetical protein
MPDINGIASWTVTSWSTYASADAGQSFSMKIFRQVAGMTYTVVGHDVSHPLAPSVLNTFQTNVTAKPGDVLGLNSGPGTSNACNFPLPMGTNDSALVRLGDLADGQPGDFNNTTPFFRVNATAVITPTNRFALGAIARNRRKGTASIAVDLPNPGELVLSGKGVKRAITARGHVTKAVAGPGTVMLRVKAKGRKLVKLNGTGRVKVKPKITFTPIGGDPNTQQAKLKLKKS